MNETDRAGLQPALDWLEANQQGEHDNVMTEEAVNENVSHEDTAPKALSCNDCGKLFSTVELAQLHATKTGHQDFAESSEAIPELSPEQKAAKLAELKKRLEERRRLQAEQDEMDARQAEVLRRKSGHAMAEARREMHEKELVKAAEQLKKDKEEEKAIRARIRAEMEEERRLRKEAADQAAQGSTIYERPAEPVRLVSQDSNSVRIQVKFPDGTAMKDVFKSDDKLSSLIEKLKSHTSIGPNSKLTIHLPRKIIQIKSEADKTFMELGLSPSASLLFEP